MTTTSAESLAVRYQRFDAFLKQLQVIQRKPA